MSVNQLLELVVADKRENPNPLFFAANATFLLVWADLFVHLILHWRAITAHENVVFFLLIFALVWLRLVKERISGLGLLIVSIAFFSVVNFVSHHF